MSKYEYRVVRSYTDGCSAKSMWLDKAFSEGFEFVRASEVVKNAKEKCDYIEYIVRREIEE